MYRHCVPRCWLNLHVHWVSLPPTGGADRSRTAWIGGVSPGGRGFPMFFRVAKAPTYGNSGEEQGFKPGYIRNHLATKCFALV